MEHYRGEFLDYGDKNFNIYTAPDSPGTYGITVKVVDIVGSVAEETIWITVKAPPPKMVLVPAGPFEMGSNQRNPDEQPVHQVYLDEFYIDQYEVTNAQYLEFLQAQGNQTEGDVPWLAIDRSRISQVGEKWQVATGYADHPVVGVSWYGARAYCDWREARLPTEAEWEKAARGTDGRTWPWGDMFPPLDETFVNFLHNIGDTTPVGSYPDGVSPYGVHDMAGNVWEWVADWYDEKYYSNSPAENPSGPSNGDDKVLRGGAWNYDGSYVRTSVRGYNNPDKQFDYIGFRCAATETLRWK